MAPFFNPDSGEVSEVVLPNAATASEVIAPNGSTVFGNAIPDVIDSYEDEDYAEYDTVDSAYGFNTNKATDGSVSGEVSSSETVKLYSQPSSELPWYPKPGSQFRIDWYPDPSGQSMFGLRFGGSDANNHYTVITRDKGDLLSFEKFESGSDTQIQTKSGFNQDNWTDQFITWDVVWNDDNSFTFSLLDPLNNYSEIISFSASDQTYSSEGGLGIYNSYWGSNTSTVQFDYLRPISQ
jgi:hypothetical protein